MSSIAVALHVIGAVIWVGGMFAIYVCVRPALSVLEPPERFRLMRSVLARMLPAIWVAIVLILCGGYWMVLVTFGGFDKVGAHVNLMQAIGWVMILLFAYLFHGPWLKFKRAADASDWPVAGAQLGRIRQVMAVNLPLGLLVVIIGASGKYWG